MIKNHPHICLFQPEIPQNTGNVARLAAATQSRLHLIKPFGFNTDDKQLRRPGLDYWPYLDLEIHDSFDDMIAAIDHPRVAFLSKFGKKNYDQIPLETNILVFGRETSGLPKEFHEKYPEDFYSIPIYHPNVRSLNLANSVAIVAYHLLGKKLNHEVMLCE